MNREDKALLPYRLQVGDSSDWAVIQRILYEAVAWNPEETIPPIEVVIEHPELARYHRDWGRRGDLSVFATRDGEVVGGAMCRLFTDDDHGHGYVDERTPELGIAVWKEHRGRGLGTRLLGALEAEAAEAGFEALSLSVNRGNPAVRLYRRRGYETLSKDEGGLRMVKRIGP